MTTTAARLADYRTVEVAAAELRALTGRGSVSGLYKAVSQGLPLHKVPGMGSVICMSELLQFIENHRKVKEARPRSRAARKDGTRGACRKGEAGAGELPGAELLKRTGVKAQ